MYINSLYKLYILKHFDCMVHSKIIALDWIWSNCFSEQIFTPLIIRLEPTAFKKNGYWLQLQFDYGQIIYHLINIIGQGWLSLRFMHLMIIIKDWMIWHAIFNFLEKAKNN